MSNGLSKKRLGHFDLLQPNQCDMTMQLVRFSVDTTYFGEEQVITKLCNQFSK